MTGKKAIMTKQQLRAAGIVVERYVPIGASAETRRTPWNVRKLGNGEGFGRFASYPEALDFVQEQLTSPEESSLKIHSEEFRARKTA